MKPLLSMIALTMVTHIELISEMHTQGTDDDDDDVCMHVGDVE